MVVLVLVLALVVALGVLLWCDGSHGGTEVAVVLGLVLVAW